MSAGPFSRGQLSNRSGTPSPSESLGRPAGQGRVADGDGAAERGRAEAVVQAGAAGDVERERRGDAERRAGPPLDRERLLGELAQRRLQLHLQIRARAGGKPVRRATPQADLVAQEGRADVPGWPQAQICVADQLPSAAALSDGKQRLGHQAAIAGERVRGGRRSLERDLPGDVHRPAEEAVTEADADVAHREPEGGLGGAESRQIAGLVQRQRELREE